MTGVFYDDWNKPDEAVKFYRKAQNLGDNAPKLWLYIAENLLKTGEEAEAKEILRALIKAVPSGYTVHDKADLLLESS